MSWKTLALAALFSFSVPAWADSYTMQPTRESTRTSDGLTLAFKHFPNPGAVPVLLVHGLAQNDRCWDPALPQYSLARFLHSRGFDVWVGNMRAAGTPGFRSDTPPGPHHWTVDDYSTYDYPALVAKVEATTGHTPFIVTHSLGTWALEGYLAGAHYTRNMDLRPDRSQGAARRAKIPGIITISGVYNVWWSKHLDDAVSDPIRNIDDYYHSDYELELLARVKPLYRVVPFVPALPLGWINSVLNLPFASLPVIGPILGGEMQKLYVDFQDSVARTPVFSMFYYEPNIDADLVRLHARDGLEDLGPRLLEQLGNAYNDHLTQSYYHLERPEGAYAYGTVLSSLDVPMLVIAGNRDRMANISMNYEDGFEKIHSSDKRFLAVDAGHLDILVGHNAPADVFAPVAEWLRAH
jgi:pimeloyl-ACP methyl ester carboxylesterase